LSHHKIKTLPETLQRQTYSPKHISFHIDIIDVHASKKLHLLYLVLININTRYLYIYPVKKKDSDNVGEALMVFIGEVEGPINL
jgi:hypothetical protein